MDANTLSPLIAATILFPGENKGAITNDSGYFEIKEISHDSGVIFVQYIGYITDTVYFSVNSSDNWEKTILLKPDILVLKEIQITSRLEGQFRAYADQQMASNIKNIVDAEQIVKFPDLNAAESISRIPGVTLQRDQGEGRYIQLRGTPPELSNFSINGEQIPSPEGGIRYVALDVIPIDQLSSVEISKALTPDMDGDAIGGAVNLKTKIARDSIPEIHAAFSGGYNQLSAKPQYNIQFAFGQRVNKFGFYANASFQKDQRYSHNMEFDFNESRFAGDTTFRIHYDDVQLRHYDITRTRAGLSGAWDYQLNNNHKWMLNVIYNRFSDDEIRRRVRYNIGSGFLTSATSSREASIERDVRDREKIQTLTSANFSGEHKWSSWGLEYLFSLSQASEEVPDRLDINFINDKINISLDLTDPDYPQVFFPRPEDAVSVLLPADYDFEEYLQQSTLTKDINFTGRFNINKSYVAGNSHGNIKFGAKARLKDKFRNNTGRIYNKYYQLFAVNNTTDSIRQIYTQAGPELTLASVQGTFTDPDLLGQQYDLGFTPDPEKSKEFLTYYFQNFKLAESDTKEEEFSEDFNASEDIAAAYTMITHQWRKWLLLAGVRYEFTRINYQGFDLRFQPFSDAFLSADTLKSHRDDGFWLPQFHLKYTPVKNTNFRAALTWTYSRPNFDDILPYRQSELDSREITQGNPDLRFARSVNLDILAEKYLPRGGYISAGLFFKSIEDFIYYYEQRVFVQNISRPGWYFVTTAQNGLDAKVAGAEFNWNQQFYQLPGIWKHFGVYFNYTFTMSAATIASRDQQQESLALPGQSPHTLNLALFFDTKKWYAKISANYNDTFLDELGIKNTWDVYYYRNLHIDYNMSFDINRYVQLYANATNLTNTPLKYYIGSPERIKQQEYYSWVIRTGCRINF